jgi:hypothetical protein
MIEFEIRHRADTLRRVYTEWWRRRYARAYWISFFIAVAAFLFMLLLRRAAWPLVALATLASAYAGFLTVLLDTAIGLALKRLEILGEAPLRFRLDEAGIRESSRIGESQVKWSGFDSVVRQRDALILVRKPRESQTFVVFPLDQVPPEAQAFIEDRLRGGNGGSA